MGFQFAVDARRSAARCIHMPEQLWNDADAVKWEAILFRPIRAACH